MNFSNTQLFIERCQKVLEGTYTCKENLNFSGRFGYKLESAFDLKYLLKNKYGCDFERFGVEIKSTVRKRITIFEIGSKDEFIWDMNPFQFLKKFGTDELGDGYTRHDRNLDAKIDDNYLHLFYNDNKIFRISTKMILHRFKKLRCVALFEGHNVSKNTNIYTEMNLIENPIFTVNVIKQMLVEKILKIESRIKTNTTKSRIKINNTNARLRSRLIFKINTKNMKKMTPDTNILSTLTPQNVPKLENIPEDIFNKTSISMETDGEVYSSILPHGYSIEYLNNNRTIEAIIRYEGREYTISNRLEFVTPAMAKQYVDTIDHSMQRDKKQKQITSLSKAFTKGNMSLISDITFYNGHLVDGQNRCHAVMDSEKPLLTYVTTTTDSTIFKKKDTGAARNFSDRNGRSPLQIGAGITMVIKYDMDTITIDGGGVVADRSIQDDYFEANSSTLMEAYKFINDSKFGTRPILMPGVAIGFLEIASRYPSDKDDAYEFIRRLLSNDSLTLGTTLHSLYRWCDNRRAVNGCRTRPETIFTQLVNGWNSYKTKAKFIALKSIFKPDRNKKRVKCPRFYWDVKASDIVSTNIPSNDCVIA